MHFSALQHPIALESTLVEIVTIASPRLLDYQ